MRIVTASIIVISSLALSATACRSPRDEADKKSAKEEQQSNENSINATMGRIKTLKEYMRSAFVTTHYLWVYVPSTSNCQSPYGPKPYSARDMTAPSDEAKRELASEKNLADPSLFDGSKAAILCSRKIKSAL